MRSLNGGGREKNYRWRCYTCRKMYTVRTGTMFEETRLPLRVWVFAFWQACASKKGISALQLAREMEITHKSALFVLRRIRHGLNSDVASKLTGTVEVDEVFVGGKPRYQGVSKRGREDGRRRARVACGETGRRQAVDVSRVSRQPAISCTAEGSNGRTARGMRR
jgi:transposase-like protein